MLHPKYRPDIDGLRAVAVLLVVLFHAFPEWVSGGFIGVDIFFVISGFLISTILFENLDRGSFSFIDFYSRRIRRIFPALITILIISLAIGWCILVAREYKQLGKHAFGGASFTSNFVLWIESSYFDNTADTKPLLHLWSLGIEEQFYIVWPMILCTLWKLRATFQEKYAVSLKYSLLLIVFLITLISFILNVDSMRIDAVATFYSPITRFWELLIGGLLAYAALYAPGALRWISSNWLSWLGIIFILLGACLINKESSFPGYWALLPVFGAAFLIGSGIKLEMSNSFPAIGADSRAALPWFNKVILSNRVLVWFGLISFPLYLWHWPILSLARIFNSGMPGPVIRGTLMITAIILSWLTYRLIEKPLRFGGYGGVKTLFLLVLMALVGLAGINIKMREGLAFREANKINIDPNSGYAGVAGVDLIDECGQGLIERHWLGTCLKDSRPPIKYALIGDSKAESLFRGLVRTSSEQGRWLYIGGPGIKGGVMPALSNDPIYQKVSFSSPLAIQIIAANPAIEIVTFVTAVRSLFGLKEGDFLEDLELSPNVDIAISGLQKAIDQFKAVGKKVVIVVDNPALANPEDCMQRSFSLNFINYFFPKKANKRCILPLEDYLKITKKYRLMLLELENKNKGAVKIFDVTPILCDEEKKSCEFSKNNRSLYSYSDHISDYASGLVGEQLNAFLHHIKN
jgi:peptidoglycan/LPS O-acetylase OafA/YrhL